MKLCEICIRNFRGIENQTISDIDDALVFIGKNNAGKSSVLTAIRVLWEDYTLAEKDFYKNSNELSISAKFFCDDEYLKDFFTNKKIGLMKKPSSANEYNDVKAETIWENVSFSDFKRSRQEVQDNGLLENVNTREQYEEIWVKSIKKYFDIQDCEIHITVTATPSTLKCDFDNKDKTILLPALAFIDDSRRFEDEESGKSRSITSNIFNVILNTELLENSNVNVCENCNRVDCEEFCINEIREKSADELSIEELQKLVNFKAKRGSTRITNSISEQFVQNYREGFKVNIKATSNINKSFSLTTKLYDPALDSELELCNVGAGVRCIYILSLLQVYQKINSKHTIFIIEEPELYLHPQLQKLMAKTLSEISKNNQVVFTTHSPLMLKEFCSSDIRRVKLDEDAYCTLIENTSLDDILSEIGYSSQDVLNTDFVLFVEGPDDKKIISYIIDKYYDIDLDRLSVIDTKSCSNVSFYATLRFLDKTKMSEDVAIMLDADTKTRDAVISTLNDKLTSNIDSPEYIEMLKERTFVTKYSSIEGYLFSPALLVQHGVFASLEEVYANLENKLTAGKRSHINYFNKQNSENAQRCSIFENEYDSKVSDISENIDWMKKNIQGHAFFGFSKSFRICFSSYVNELPKETFEDILHFLDTIPYFANRKKITDDSVE